MSGVDASLVVPSYRGASRLAVLFEALRRQEFDGSWEAVVVLDGVEDESPQVIEQYDDLPVRTVAFDENRGRSAALNAGFRAARGRVLIRCDDDLEPHPTYLRDHVAAHDAPGPVGAIGIYRNVFPPTPYSKAYGIPYDEVFRNGAYAAPASERWHFWAGNCSVTRDTFDRVGGYDENFRSYGWEDVDWGYRLHLTGAEIKIVPELETRHHAANTTTQIRVRRAFLSGGAHHRFDRKHGIEPERPTVGGLPAKVWNEAVGVLARNGAMARYERLGKVVDRLLRFAPRRIGVKLVALPVEAAAIAGYRAEGTQGDGRVAVEPRHAD